MKSYEIVSIAKPVKATRHNLCPICGKPDWCYVSTSTYRFEDGNTFEFDFVCCRRDSSPSVCGQDGKFYVYDRESKDNVNIFEEVNQRAFRFEKMGRDQNVKAPRDYLARVSKERIFRGETPIASKERRHAVYTALLGMLKLEAYHQQHLLDEGWSEDMINKAPFVSLPMSGYQVSVIIKKKMSNSPLSLQEQFYSKCNNKTRKKIAQDLSLKFDLTGIPGFYLNQNRRDNTDYWDMSGAAGMLMPMYDINGLIFGLRIRVDEAKGGKYKWFASFYEEVIFEDDKIIISENKFKSGTKAQSEMSYMFPSFQTPFLFVTEGEKKQYVVVNKKQIACADVPGVSSFGTMINDIPALKERGIKYIIIGYDADKSSNAQVLKAELKLIRELLLQGFEIFIAGWSESLGKGVDDVLLSGNDTQYETLSDYLTRISQE